MKNYKGFTFEERKQYEETFEQSNSALIEELTASHSLGGAIGGSIGINSYYDSLDKLGKF